MTTPDDRGTPHVAPRPWLVPVALGCTLLAVVVLHAGAIARPFFADDYLFLENVRGRTLLAVLSSPDPIGNYLRPVSRQVYFWLVTRLGGESPSLFHSLGLFIYLGALLTYFAIARRLVGRVGALVAVAFVALHYAADVPLRWASGSQDLLAILFAALAILAAMAGYRGWAAVALAFGLLSKEVVAGTALIALIAGRQSGERWPQAARRSWALIATTVVWSCWRVLAAPHSSGLDGHAPTAALLGSLAAAAHLAQVAVSAEFRLAGNPVGHWHLVGFLPAIIVAATVAWAAMLSASNGAEPSPGSTHGSSVRAIAFAWIVLGTAPVALVSSAWSAYFYLWALFGVGILLASLTNDPRPAVRAALLATLLSLSAGARALDEFEVRTDSWTWQSHVNRHYIDRSLDTVERYLREMRHARPTLPRHSTIFFANVPPASGWQTADGPVIRWAYQDSTLHSYFLTQFSAARSRGPLFFFSVDGDALKDHTNDPELLPSFAYSMLLSEHPRSAIDALDLALRNGARPAPLAYWRGLAKWGIGDTTSAKDDLGLADMAPRRTGRAAARVRLAEAWTDTLARLESLSIARDSAALDPYLHARLAALYLQLGRVQEGAIEAYAYRALKPDEPDAWRKWASSQLAAQQFAQGLISLEHYLVLAKDAGQTDREAEAVAANLRRFLRGDLAHERIRRIGTRP